jgi:hypothetical protein
VIRTGYEVYEGYITEHEQEIAEGKELILEVRDLETFVRMIVKAIVSKEADAIEGGSSLWLKDLNDEIVPKPGSIKILEELDDDEYQAIKSDKGVAAKGRSAG